MPAGLPKDGTRHSRKVALPMIHPVQQGLINFGGQTLTGAFFFLKSWQLLSWYCDHRNNHFANACCEYPDYKITKA